MAAQRHAVLVPASRPGAARTGKGAPTAAEATPAAVGGTAKAPALLPFERVVELHGSVVLRVCRVLVGQQDAEDAWSETFLAALRTYPDLAPDANVEAWLVTIARNKCIDVHRRSARLPIPLAELPERPSLSEPHTLLERDEDLWAALQNLPDKQRRAVVYHHLAGLPYAQVAEVLGNSEAAARRAAADGIRSLRGTYPFAVSPVDRRTKNTAGEQP
ncbi:MAG: sigma-70 factor [Micrococcaceae bacterium]|nr:sigma-70 factor [Micrococcaceae bacterium]